MAEWKVEMKGALLAGKMVVRKVDLKVDQLVPQRVEQKAD